MKVRSSYYSRHVNVVTADFAQVPRLKNEVISQQLYAAGAPLSGYVQWLFCTGGFRRSQVRWEDACATRDGRYYHQPVESAPARARYSD